MKQSQRRDHLDFNYAMRSFLGYLEGTSKAHHTIKSYQSDLVSFKNFLESGLGSKPVGLHQIKKTDLDLYSEHLRGMGLKSNSRRRRLMTIRKWLGYLKIRNQMTLDVAGKIATPYKVEKVPAVIDYLEFKQKIKALPGDSPVQRRNKILFWLMLETGALVSEIVSLTKEQIDLLKKEVQFEGKNKREVPISQELCQMLQEYILVDLPQEVRGLFLAQNRLGKLIIRGQTLTTRAAELLVKAHIQFFVSESLDETSIVPRLWRHSVVLHWHQEGYDNQKIKTLLGLKSMYAFKVYQALFNQFDSA